MSFHGLTIFLFFSIFLHSAVVVQHLIFHIFLILNTSLFLWCTSLLERVGLPRAQLVEAAEFPVVLLY